MSRAAPSRLVTSGLAELAAGALSGWVYTVARTQPELSARLGIKSAARVRQWHLDLAMLGTATVACGLAMPDPPRVAAEPELAELSPRHAVELPAGQTRDSNVPHDPAVSSGRRIEDGSLVAIVGGWDVWWSSELEEVESC